MSQSSNKITTSLDSFIKLALGFDMRGSRTLPDYDTGLILHSVIKDDLMFKVQFENFDGSPLDCPVLWSYPEWYNSSQNWHKQKDSSEKRRIALWILQANIKIVAKRLIAEFEFSQDQANAIAYSWIHSGKKAKIRSIGVTKLVTREEELM
jgi:hypothetical protein